MMVVVFIEMHQVRFVSVANNGVCSGPFVEMVSNKR